MFILQIFSYIIIGLFAGFLGGLFGIGGGLITVPYLALIFHFLGMPSETIMHMAVGTSLGAMIFTSASSAWAHYLKKGIRKDVLLILLPGTMIGAYLGAVLALKLSSKGLAIFFAVCEILTGIYFLFPALKSNRSTNRLTKKTIFLLAFLGLMIGAVSTMLGIGGGLIAVPILTFFGLPLKQSISTSAGLGFSIAIIGAFSFLYAGWSQVTPVDQSIGYLYIPAFISIGIAASLMAPYGAKVAYLLPTYHLKRAFGILLILIGMSMIWE